MHLVVSEERPALAFSGFLPARCRLFHQFDAHEKVTIRCAVAFRALPPSRLPAADPLLSFN